jgi:hypothetical protein
MPPPNQSHINQNPLSADHPEQVRQITISPTAALLHIPAIQPLVASAAGISRLMVSRFGAHAGPVHVGQNRGFRLVVAHAWHSHLALLTSGAPADGGLLGLAGFWPGRFPLAGALHWRLRLQRCFPFQWCLLHCSVSVVPCTAGAITPTGFARLQLSNLTPQLAVFVLQIVAGHTQQHLCIIVFERGAILQAANPEAGKARHGVEHAPNKAAMTVRAWGGLHSLWGELRAGLLLHATTSLRPCR